MVADEPENAYFHELKGQMLVEFSRIEEAIPAYRRAVDLRPDAALLRIAYAHALMQGGYDKRRFEQAIENLQIALSTEERSTRAHRLLARAYGQMGEENWAKIHLAEEALLQRRRDAAKRQATSVVNDAREGSAEWLRAQDLLAYIKTLKGD